jgi:hypothetical protein
MNNEMRPAPSHAWVVVSLVSPRFSGKRNGIKKSERHLFLGLALQKEIYFSPSPGLSPPSFVDLRPHLCRLPSTPSPQASSSTFQLIGCPPLPSLAALHVSCMLSAAAQFYRNVRPDDAAAQVIPTPLCIGISVGISNLHRAIVVGCCCARTKAACWWHVSVRWLVLLRGGWD